MIMSLSKSQYFISFVDDSSRKTWIYFMRTKYESFGKFVAWKTLVENQTDRKIKRLRTDNGLEFCNTEFDSFCEQHGIARKHTYAYTPQKNGVAERFNRTIMDTVRCMLAGSGLRQKLWAEAATTVCYLINRSPNSSLEFKVPEHVWSNHKPIYSHLKVFGCIAYVHTSQDKLNPRASQMCFLRLCSRC